MKLSKGALVAVVDGEKLALFRNEGGVEIRLKAIENPPIEDRVSGSAGRRSSEANPDNDTQAEDGFAMGVAQVLNKWVVTNKIDELLVIAAPKTLGELRKHWHKQTERALLKEYHKDLIGRQPADIVAAMRETH